MYLQYVNTKLGKLESVAKINRQRVKIFAKGLNKIKNILRNLVPEEIRFFSSVVSSFGSALLTFRVYPVFLPRSEGFELHVCAFCALQYQPD